VVGGMVSGTVLAIFFVPLFFVTVRRLFDRRPKTAAAPLQPHTDTPLLQGH
jgi:multidrug efflux pump